MALSVNEYRALLKEHGSHEAAIEARPDLADELRAMQRLGEDVGEWMRNVTRAVESIRPPVMSVPEPDPLPGLDELADLELEAPGRGVREGARTACSLRGEKARGEDD
jgi:hypothetical protein